ncbi:putative ribonuclease H-like domain-containing protein [Tanacetum coccineum]
MAGADDEIVNNPPPTTPVTQQAPHTMSIIKLPILKKDTSGQIKILPPKSTEEILARERERKARTTLLMAILEDHLARFHKMTDPKEMWEAIKSRFGGNDESKKMQKYILKQQFESFSVSNLEGLHKGYDRFQSLLSQLEIHGAGVSTENANQKFLRSLPSSWSQVSLIMRTKPGTDTMSFDDLYNNLRVFETDVKGSNGSSSSTQNVAFVSSECTSSTNEVSTAYGVSTSSGYNSQREGFSSYSDELMYSFFGNQDIRRKDAENTGYKARDNRRRPANQAESNALVAVDGDGIDWTGHAEEDIENYALMTHTHILYLSHLIRDCDFHEKRMAKNIELTKKNGKGTGQGEDRPVWNNVQRLNHKNKFVPTAVLTRTGRFPINTARQVNTAGPRMNVTRPRNSSYKSQSPIRRPLNRTTAPKTNFLNHSVNTVRVNTVSTVGGNRETAVKASAGCNWRSKRHYWSKDDPHKALKDKGIVDSGCSRHMTGNKAYLAEYQEFNGGSVTFGGSKGNITGKGKIKTGKLNFEDVYFMKELKQFNLFYVSQMCDKKNKVLFTDTECLVLSPDFKLPDENQVLLRVPRQHNMYSFNLENIAPSRGLACLIAKATIDESNKWHRRLGHVNFKNLNILVMGNLDETSGILKDFIRQIENQLNQKVKTIRCDNGTEFKNKEMIEFCGSKGSRGNTTMVLVTKPQNKTPYELLTRKIPIISYIRPFGCHVTILNTIDKLGKFDGKFNEGFLVGYSLNSKAFRVYNLETKRVEENLHINFLENKPNVAGKGPTWLFDLDYLTDSMNYQPVSTENKANKTACPKEANTNACTKDDIDAGNSKREAEPAEEYFVLPLWSSYTSTVKSSEAKNGGLKDKKKEADDNTAEALRKEFAQSTEDLLIQAGAARASSTNTVNIASTPVSTASTPVHTVSPSGVFNIGEPSFSYLDLSANQDDSQIAQLEDIYENPSDGIFTNAFYDDEGAMVSFTNLESTMIVSLIPTSRVHSIHPKAQIIGDPKSAVYTRRKVNNRSGAHAFVNYIQKQRRNNHKDFQHYEEAAGVDVHHYRSMIGSLMYLTASRPDIMFAVCACSRFQVTQKTSHLHAVKRIFRYLKGQPKLGLWYPRVSSFDLEAYSDSDYARANLDRKSTTGGCQFIGRRLISWQCKKQTIVATSTTEAEYVATANCGRQVLWIQNQMLDYGFNFINTKIYINNETTIFIVKNPVFHSKTKHIEIRHHFIRDAYEKKLIQVLKIHTNDNVADLLTKAFDVSRFHFLVVNIGMMNL